LKFRVKAPPISFSGRFWELPETPWEFPELSLFFPFLGFRAPLFDSFSSPLLSSFFPQGKEDPLPCSREDHPSPASVPPFFFFFAFLWIILFPFSLFFFPFFFRDRPEPFPSPPSREKNELEGELLCPQRTGSLMRRREDIRASPKNHVFGRRDHVPSPPSSFYPRAAGFFFFFFWPVSPLPVAFPLNRPGYCATFFSSRWVGFFFPNPCCPRSFSPSSPSLHGGLPLSFPRTLRRKSPVFCRPPPPFFLPFLLASS